MLLKCIDTSNNGIGCMKNNPELAVIIPAYNEEEIVSQVIESWRLELDKLNLTYEIHVYNDGSKDNTGKKLDDLAKNYRNIIIHHQENKGHGPTILNGYLQHSNIPWLFQVDSDNEMRHNSFSSLWNQRTSYDLLVARRINRKSPATRWAIAKIASLFTTFLFGKGIEDVNAPFRLMRSDAFKKIFLLIPKNSFAPNILISGATIKCGLRIYTHNIPFTPRKTGKVSIKHWKLFRAAIKSFWQTICFALALHANKEK